jgi:membrane-associated protease RseP (regulator of RpoE activity)
MFFALRYGGTEPTARVKAVPARPAALAGIQDGDLVVAVDGSSIETFAELADRVRDGAGRALRLDLDRSATRVTLEVSPGADGKIGVVPLGETRVIAASEVAQASLTEPVRALVYSVRALAVAGTRSAAVLASGPVAVHNAARATPGSPVRWVTLVVAYGCAVALPFLVVWVVVTGVLSERRRPTP